MITIFSTTNCAFCKTEKQWLDSLDIKYVSKNIQEDEQAFKEFQALNLGNGVPVTIITQDNSESVIVRGFDREKLTHALLI